jgi:hypothetical protein
MTELEPISFIAGICIGTFITLGFLIWELL